MDSYPHLRPHDEAVKGPDIITDFLAWSVNSALESSWLGTNPFQMCCFWKTKKEYIHIKKKKEPNKIFQGNWDDAVVRASASYRAGLGSFLRPDVTCGPCKPSGFSRFSSIHKINMLNSTRAFTQTQILLTKLHIDWFYLSRFISCILIHNYV